MPCKKVEVTPPSEKYKIAAVNSPSSVNTGESFDIEVEATCSSEDGCKDVPYTLTVGEKTVVGEKAVTMGPGHSATGPFSVEGVVLTEPGMVDVIAQFGEEKVIKKIAVQPGSGGVGGGGTELKNLVKDNKRIIVAGAGIASALLGGG